MPHLSHEEFLRLWKLKPMAATDCVVVKDKKILLIKRATSPYRGYWCLPGGIMDTGETIEQTALRELKEETGITGKIISLVGVYSGPKRDPRGTTMTAAFLIEVVRIGGEHDHEISEVKFFTFNKLPKKMGFDHKRIVKDALPCCKKIKNK